MSRDPRLAGLEDKTYWRPTKSGFRWHCFERLPGRARGYESLCGNAFTKRSGGQSNARPPVMARCALCDGVEMRMRHWLESGPTANNWDDFCEFDGVEMRA